MVTNTGTSGGKFLRIWDGILKGTAYASGAFIFVLMLLMSYQVIVRYFFKASTGWVPDFATDIQYIVVMLATAWVLRVKKHTKLDVLVVGMKPMRKRILDLALNILSLAACALFFYLGLKATIVAFSNGDTIYREIIVPLGPLLAFIPFSFLMLSIQLVIDIINDVRFLMTGGNKPAQS